VSTQSAARDDWDTHWRHYAGSAADNPAEIMRAEIVKRCLRLKPRARVVDIGSGQGDLAAMLAREYPEADLIGLELSAEGVALASEKVPSARFVQRDLLRAETVSGDLAGFADYAVCSEVLEHVDDPKSVLLNARTYLAPGCRVVITVPGGPMSAFDRHIGHRRHHTSESLRQIVEDAGLEPTAVFRAGFPFFNLYRLTVILRGRSLIADVAGDETDTVSSKLAALVMRLFRALFRFNLMRSPWGWQMVAIARVPPTDSISSA
jgi:SAM-dependent methyltransferase